MAMRLIALAGLVIAVMLLAGGFVAARLYYEAGGAPADVVFLRYGISALCLLPLVLWRRARLARVPGWPRALVLTGLGGVPFGLFVLTGVAGAPVTHGAGVVPGIALVFGTLLSVRLLGEPLGRWRLAGLAGALGGLALLVGPDLGRGDATWWGEAAYAVAGLFWGAFTVMLRRYGVPPLDGAALAAVFSLPYVPVYFLVLAPQLPEVAIADTLFQGLYQGVIFNIGAVALYAWGIRRLGATAAVAAMPLMPACGLAMDWLLFERAAHVLALPAVGLIAAGVALAALLPGRPPVRPGSG